eukprot:TRINITY_DN859_c0_g1_i1.p1 TRINITY_DN859_c0_g1~~TRINITY_DN859_c0_g1_i1.p1  ORF type:complete len:436 (+),score=105.92 TRINITY_DN859_c0_g1_i1:165-1310(+)
METSPAPAPRKIRKKEADPERERIKAQIRRDRKELGSNGVNNSSRPPEQAQQRMTTPTTSPVTPPLSPARPIGPSQPKMVDGVLVYVPVRDSVPGLAPSDVSDDEVSMHMSEDSGEGSEDEDAELTSLLVKPTGDPQQQQMILQILMQPMFDWAKKMGWRKLESTLVKHGFQPSHILQVKNTITSTALKCPCAGCTKLREELKLPFLPQADLTQAQAELGGRAGFSVKPFHAPEVQHVSWGHGMSLTAGFDAGPGHVLGTASASETSPATTTPTPAAAETPQQMEVETPKESLLPVTVDQATPTTTIRVQLYTGTTLTSTFNTAHTIGHIRQQIAWHMAQTGEKLYPYDLMTRLPRQIFTDLSTTIAAAHLQNSALLLVKK